MIILAAMISTQQPRKPNTTIMKGFSSSSWENTRSIRCREKRHRSKQGKQHDFIFCFFIVYQIKHYQPPPHPAQMASEAMPASL